MMSHTHTMHTLCVATRRCVSANLLLAETNGSVRKVKVKLLWVALLKGSSLRLYVRMTDVRQKRSAHI